MTGERCLYIAWCQNWTTMDVSGDVYRGDGHNDEHTGVGNG
jgi:hypothetical protein